MRQIILATVFCLSLFVHTVEAETDALLMNPDTPFKEKYTAIDAEVDGLLEALQTEYQKALDDEKKQYGEHRAQLYEDVPSVFDRADKERALNNRYRERRRELDQDLNASKKGIYALRTTARQQLSRNQVVDVGVWNSMKSFDTTLISPGAVLAPSTAMGRPDMAIPSAGTSAGATGLGDANNVTTDEPNAEQTGLGHANETPQGSGTDASGSGNEIKFGAAEKAPAANTPMDIPKIDKDKGSYTWADGTTTSVIGPDGSVGEVTDKGDIVFDDGSSVSHTGDHQVSVRTPDATSAQFETGSSGTSDATARGSSSGGLHGNTTVDTPKFDSDKDSYTWSDGTTVTEIRPNGGAGTINDKGDIVFDDGATIVHSGNHEVIVHEPDGSSRTYHADDQGQWVASDTKKGSDDKYGGGSGGHSSGQSGGKGKGSGKDDDGANDSSGSSDSDNDNDDDKGKDSDTDAEADTETDSTDADADDDKGKGSSKESYGEVSGAYASGPNALMQGIVDRATGNSTQPDSGVPEECGSNGAGGTVSQPGMGSSGGCIPAGLPGISTDENQPETPRASDAVISEDQRRAAGAGISDRIGQPGIQDQGLPIGDLPSHKPLDHAPVTNPEPQN